jgi:hypothetical protein
MVSTKLFDAVAPAAPLSVTVTVAVLPVGVPEITPVDELSDKPAGSPDADQLYGDVPAAPVSVAL